MLITQNQPAAPIFPKEAIYEQLERIFSHSSFATSDILKRFLSFVVDETLAGHSNTIKEYTIGTQVLNKAIDFTPQHDAIVRIHAGRLRRALNHYYKSTANGDPVYIAIPKGSYVPVFTTREAAVHEDEDRRHDVFTLHSKKHVVLGVIPFSHFETDPLRIGFAHGLGVQLSTELSHQNFSMVSYFTMSRIAKKIVDIREIAPAVGAHFVFTGDIQYQEDNCRVNIQLINADTNQQLWGETYQRKFNPVNVFGLQDQIVRKVIAAVAKPHTIDEKPARISMATVA
ncbi:MAG TPA: hypothetical protein VEV83_08195 [Parafilimonas sp.]|nr:hypothetical protein [Parafilimonas sp.]